MLVKIDLIKEDENVGWYRSGESEGEFGLFPRLSYLMLWFFMTFNLTSKCRTFLFPHVDISLALL